MLDFTIPYTPQLNGKAERMNRTLMDKARALIFDCDMEKEMWGEAVQTAAYLINRSPTTALNKTPAEMWYKRKPDISKLESFGITAFAKNLHKVKKFDARSKQYVFVGYGVNGYRLWDSNKREIITARDVIFKSEPMKINKDKTEIGSVDYNEESNEDSSEENNEERNEDSSEENNEENHKNADQMRDDSNERINPRYNLRLKKDLQKPSRYKDYETDFKSDIEFNDI